MRDAASTDTIGEQAGERPPMSISQFNQHRVLAICTEWDSKHGGLPAFNRQLCTAIAAEEAWVVCLVLSATAAEKRHAEQGGVTLIEAADLGEMTEALALARRPALPAGFVPTVIIGHSRVTGAVAKALQEDHFPEAKRLHVVHVAPDEIEWHKLDRGDDAATRAEGRTETELFLARNAHRVVAVGPQIFHRLQNDLVPDEILPLQIDPGFDGTDAIEASAPAGLWRVLIMGRLEDAELKGLDIAARALGQTLRWRGRTAPAVEFVIRGAPAKSADALRRQALAWAQVPSLKVVVRPYTHENQRLAADLRRASLVLMPSRAEGFGLVGVEAIVSGTPVLISESSGLGVLLDRTLQPDDVQRVVVAMAGDDDEIVERWARAIDAILRDRDAAFRRASDIRQQLASRKTWPMAAQTVLAAVGPVTPEMSHRPVTVLQPVHRQALMNQLATIEPPMLWAAYAEITAGQPASPRWQDVESAVEALERLPVTEEDLSPRLLAWVERVAHQLGRREYKALHEWLDSAGSAIGLDQKAIREMCRTALRARRTIKPDYYVESSTSSDNLLTSNGDQVSKPVVLDENEKEVIDRSDVTAEPRPVRGNIPIRNPDFTGREDLLSSLRAALLHSSKASVLPRALHGLGGVGKTQLALEYVYVEADQYDLIWWISAEHPSLVLDSLATLCEELGLPQSIDQKQTAETVKRHLSVSSMRWLLVFDNADEPSDIVPLVPSAGGHVIITSRNQEWSNASDAIEVNVFSRGESVALLRKRSQITESEADRLAETLGDLPLALDQARSWQAATGMRVSEYLELFQTHVRELMSEGKPPWYPTTVAAFVSLAFERLRDAKPEVAQLFELFAFLGAEPISVGMLQRAREAAISEPLRLALRDPILLSRAIRDLRRFGLAKVTANQRIQVHRLVQMVLREELDDELKKLSKGNVQRILAAANPAQPDNVGRYRMVYQEIGPHITAADLINSDLHGARQVVLDQIRYLYVTGDYERSRGLGEMAVAAWRAATGEGVGPDGGLTLIANRHLANALRDLGEKEQARVLDADVYRRLEESREFGPEHEHTLATAMGVAVDMRVAGRYQEALEIDELNVERHRTVFGDEDELTLRARSNSAVNLRMLGHFNEALAVDEQLVHEWREAVGEDDPRYMFCVVNRALDLNGRGRYAEALESLRTVFPRYRELLGAGHVYVLRTARALGVSLRKNGQYVQALEWTRETYHDCDARLGPNHEQTLAAAMSYANAQCTAGEVGAARSTAVETVGGYQAAFGVHHPLTLVANVNLAIIYRAVGETHEARQLDESTLENMRRVLGPEHGYTLCAASSFANDMAVSHDLRGARDLSMETLEVSRRVRGERHPYTLSCAVNTALNMQAVDEEPAGLALLDATVSQLSEVLGQDHPETIDAGRFKRAECDIEPPPT